MKLSSKDLKEHVIIVGDIHGCLDEFKSILEECKYASGSTSVVNEIMLNINARQEMHKKQAKYPFLPVIERF